MTDQQVWDTSHGGDKYSKGSPMEFQDRGWPVGAAEAPHPQRNPQRRRDRAKLFQSPSGSLKFGVVGAHSPKFAPREGTATSNTFPALPPGLFAVPVHVPEVSTSLFHAPLKDPGLGRESSPSGKERDKN